MEEKFSKLKLSKKDVVLIALALIAIGWAVYFFIKREEVVDYSPTVTRTTEKLAPGFPEGFLLEKNINVSESAFLTYTSTGDKLWNASYVSSLTPKDVILKYESYFAENGWAINNSEPSSLIFAEKGNEQASVYIKDEQGQIKVLVSILQRK